METLWNAIESVFVIFLLIGAGIFVAWRKWVSRDVAGVLSKIVINIAVPGTLVYGLAANFTRQQLLASWLPLLVIFTVMPISFYIGKLFARICKVEKGRRGTFAVLFSLSNSVFIGFPVAQALFGAPGMPFAVFYYLGNTVVFWTVGYLSIRRDADVLGGRESRVTAADMVRKLLTPPVIATVLMIALILADAILPPFVLKTAEYMGGMTTPLSLLFTGCMIYYIGFKGLKFERSMLPVLFGRFILVPALCFGACMIVINTVPAQSTGYDLYMMRNVFTVQMGLPAMMQTTILAELYGADVKYATKNVVATTLFSLLTIPAYMALLTLV